MFILLRTLLLVPSPRILHPPSEEHHLVHGFSHCCTPITSKCMSPQPRQLSCAFPISFSESVHGIIHWNVYGNLGSTYPLEGEYLFFTSFVFFQWGVILISITLLVSLTSPSTTERRSSLIGELFSESLCSWLLLICRKISGKCLTPIIGAKGHPVLPRWGGWSNSVAP